MPPSLKAAYNRRLADGLLTADTGQRLAVEQLDRLFSDLAAAERPALFRKAARPRSASTSGGRSVGASPC